MHHEKQNTQLHSDMMNWTPCKCPDLDLKTTLHLGILGESPEKLAEEIDKIDKDELVEDKTLTHNLIWNEINDKFYSDRRQIEEYNVTKRKECETPPSNYM